MTDYDSLWLDQVHDVIPPEFDLPPKQLETLPIINNLVHVTYLQRKLERSLLLALFMNSSRKPVKFPQVKIVTAIGNSSEFSPVITMLVYKSGRVVLSGACNTESVIFVVQYLRRDFMRCGVYTGFMPSMLSNVVVHATLPYFLDLERLKQDNAWLNFVKSEFPGLMFNVNKNHEGVLPSQKARRLLPQNVLDSLLKEGVDENTVEQILRVLAFTNGKVVVTGGKRWEDVVDGMSNIISMLKPYAVAPNTQAASRLASSSSAATAAKSDALPSQVRRAWIDSVSELSEKTPGSEQRTKKTTGRKRSHIVHERKTAAAEQRKRRNRLNIRTSELLSAEQISKWSNDKKSDDKRRGTGTRRKAENSSDQEKKPRKRRAKPAHVAEE